MTGKLKVKNGLYYAVINYKDNFNRYKQKWIATGLKERGNKKEAQKILDEELAKFSIEQNDNEKLYLFNGVKYRELIPVRHGGNNRYAISDIEGKRIQMVHKVLFG